MGWKGHHRANQGIGRPTALDAGSTRTAQGAPEIRVLWPQLARRWSPDESAEPTLRISLRAILGKSCLLGQQEFEE
jgi:hypothetical protein